MGSFSYTAPNGQVFRTDYVADALGYRVSSNALPVGPSADSKTKVSTPEVSNENEDVELSNLNPRKLNIAQILLPNCSPGRGWSGRSL